MSERMKIEFYDGKGNVSDCWSVTLDGVSIGAFYISEDKKRFPSDEEHMVINFYFGWVSEAQLTTKPQENRLQMRRELSQFIEKGEDENG